MSEYSSTEKYTQVQFNFFPNCYKFHLTKILIHMHNHIIAAGYALWRSTRWNYYWEQGKWYCERTDFSMPPLMTLGRQFIELGFNRGGLSMQKIVNICIVVNSSQDHTLCGKFCGKFVLSIVCNWMHLTVVKFSLSFGVMSNQSFTSLICST